MMSYEAITPIDGSIANPNQTTTTTTTNELTATAAVPRDPRVAPSTGRRPSTDEDTRRRPRHCARLAYQTKKSNTKAYANGRVYTIPVSKMGFFATIRSKLKRDRSSVRYFWCRSSSDTVRPAAGDCIKPWPEKPVHSIIFLISE